VLPRVVGGVDGLFERAGAPGIDPASPRMHARHASDSPTVLGLRRVSGVSAVRGADHGAGLSVPTTRKGDAMTSTSVAARNDSRVARPLRVLVSLIQDDLKQGREAAERAGMPYYQAAGEKLIEAKGQLAHGEFQPWVKRHFPISPRQAQDYMGLAKHVANQNGSALPFSSLSEFIRETSNPNYNRPSSWHEPVKQILDRVDTETLNLKREELKRDEERDAQRKLAVQLIDIGFKVLAKTLHPDKGGSRAAMARLNAVRDRLKQCI
jgi:hypothetical protein